MDDRIFLTIGGIDLRGPRVLQGLADIVDLVAIPFQSVGFPVQAPVSGGSSWSLSFVTLLLSPSNPVYIVSR